ncbi:hypothetical protein OCGS_2700 [Oceaniovalibus guishaninsula JLT2003]|uniref:Uncharacterized protein n=1 Tax=Oceaniovalibus guishaninsula JLT2003 TaxID=1231392 RepID=K2HJE5_9RHOB|nr:hypothetical protein OCGS_2700 [Oceaniovalibus guishaninsula JLT2003]
MTLVSVTRLRVRAVARLARRSGGRPLVAGRCALPDPAAARTRLARDGRMTKLRHPSKAQRAGERDTRPGPIRMGPRLRPRK